MLGWKRSLQTLESSRTPLLSHSTALACYVSYNMIYKGFTHYWAKLSRAKPSCTQQTLLHIYHSFWNHTEKVIVKIKYPSQHSLFWVSMKVWKGHYQYFFPTLQVGSLRPDLQRVLVQWGQFEKELGDVSFYTTKLRCGLEHSSGPFLSSHQVKRHVEQLQVSVMKLSTI